MQYSDSDSSGSTSAEAAYVQCAIQPIDDGSSQRAKVNGYWVYRMGNGRYQLTFVQNEYCQGSGCRALLKKHWNYCEDCGKPTHLPMFDLFEI